MLPPEPLWIRHCIRTLANVGPPAKRLIHVNGDSLVGFYMFTGIVIFLFSGPDATSARHDKMMFGGLLVLLYTSFIVAVVLTAHFNS